MQLLLSGTTDVRMYVAESARTFENILQIYSEKDTYLQRLQNLIHNKDNKVSISFYSVSCTTISDWQQRHSFATSISTPQ